MQLQLQLQLQLPLPLPSGSPSVYRRVVGARSGKRCGVCLSAAQRSEFSRAPLRAPTAREPRAAGRHSRGRLFLPTFFGEAKEVGRPPGRTPGLVMTTVRCCWVIRRKDVTAKQQLPLTLKVLLKTLLKSKPTVLPVPCRVTQCGCTAVEASRDSVPAAGSLFLLRRIYSVLEFGDH